MEQQGRWPGDTQETEAASSAKQEELLKHSNKLRRLAAKAARHDRLDLEASSKTDAIINISSIPVALTGSILSGMNSLPPETAPVVASWSLMGAANALNFAAIRRAKEKYRTVELSGGNAIQCLRIAENPEAMPDGKVALAIHSPDFGEDPDAAGQTRASMAEALEIIAHAHEADTKNRLGGILIAESDAREAGLPFAPTREYKEFIANMSEEPANVPYEGGVMVVSPDVAAELAERLRREPKATLGDVLGGLSERHPAIAAALSADNPDIVATLHNILRRTADADGRSVRWEKDMSTIEGTEVWMGGRRKVIEDVASTLDARNPYNPRLISRSAQSGRELSNRDLRTMTGGERGADAILRQLETGNVDDVQLVRVALELLEAKDAMEVEAPNENAPTLQEPDKDQKPRRITIGEGVDRWKHCRRQVTKTVLGSAAVFAAVQTTIAGVHSVTEGQDKSIVQGQLFRVENHGLTQESPYWNQATHYAFSDGEWNEADGPQQKLTLPRTLQREDAPHLTVSVRLGDGELDLPIEEDTRLAALRAYDSHHDPVQITAYKSGDGVVTVDANQAAGAFLEYDLVAGDGPSVHATKPLTVKGEMFYSDLWKKSFDGAAEGAEYIRDNYVYDDAQKQHEALAETNSPEEYVNHLLETGRCQCQQCNTEVALMESQVRPEQDLALVTGYLHERPAGSSHSYLVESHAWLNDGRTIDATAKTMDENSVAPHYPDTTTLDKRWQANVETVLNEAESSDESQCRALWALCGAAAIGLTVLEARHRPLRRTANAYVDFDRRVTAATKIAPDDALQLMGWQAYGEWTSPVPALGKASHTIIPKEKNIPTSTLEEIARGEFRASGQLTESQQRGLRQTAAAMLRTRRKS